MRTDQAARTGFLTVFSADGREIYGEFADADWVIEEQSSGRNHLFTGTAGEGTLETFRRINAEGIDHVSYCFETDGVRYSGSAQLLAPRALDVRGQALIQIESTSPPVAS